MTGSSRRAGVPIGVVAAPAGAAVRHRHAASPRWSELRAAARAVRVGHVGIAGAGLASVGYLWACALTGRRDRWLAVAMAWLTGQGLAVAVGRGHCPLGPLQERLGDPTPCFELVLPRRAAKAAFAVLFPVTVIGFALVLRRPGVRTPPPQQPRATARGVAFERCERRAQPLPRPVAVARTSRMVVAPNTP